MAGRFQRAPDAGRATTLELFYDLVFVFAITQVSHHLLEHLSWHGALESAVLLLAVWWSWNYTTWATNELDPESPVVRAVVVLVMLGSLLMSVAIPEAFGGRGLLFAIAYVAIQVGRHGFVAFAAAPGGSPERVRAERIWLYFVVAAVPWIAGGVVEGDARLVLWLVALAIELSGPLTSYWVPGRGRMPMTAWEVRTEHFAERFQLFLIIALGETIVITGATTSELELTAGRSAAFVVAFLGTAALWWLYFNYAATMAQRRLELAGEGRTALARDAYTYLHVVLVAGVIVSAVGDELVIAHPDEHLHLGEALAVCAGPALYLLGQALFRLRMARSVSYKRGLGAVGCLACLGFATAVPALALALVLLAILVAVIAAEQVSGRRRAARGEPSPLERLA